MHTLLRSIGTCLSPNSQKIHKFSIRGKNAQWGPTFLKTTRKFTKEKFSVRSKYAPWGKAKQMQLAQLGPGFLQEILLANSSGNPNLCGAVHAIWRRLHQLPVGKVSNWLISAMDVKSGSPPHFQASVLGNLTSGCAATLKPLDFQLQCETTNVPEWTRFLNSDQFKIRNKILLIGLSANYKTILSASTLFVNQLLCSPSPGSDEQLVCFHAIRNPTPCRLYTSYHKLSPFF